MVDDEHDRKYQQSGPGGLAGGREQWRLRSKVAAEDTAERVRKASCDHCDLRPDRLAEARHRIDDDKRAVWALLPARLAQLPPSAGVPVEIG